MIVISIVINKYIIIITIIIILVDIIKNKMIMGYTI